MQTSRLPVVTLENTVNALSWQKATPHVLLHKAYMYEGKNTFSGKLCNAETASWYYCSQLEAKIILITELTWTPARVRES